MPTPELTDFVSTVTETIDQVLHDNPMVKPDSDQVSAYAADGTMPAYLFNFDKIVWHYPDAPSRLIEE